MIDNAGTLRNITLRAKISFFLVSRANRCIIFYML